jgi:hypothetical protein
VGGAGGARLGRARARRRGDAGVVLAADPSVVRMGLRVLVDREPDMSVVGEAGDGRAVLDRVRETIFRGRAWAVGVTSPERWSWAEVARAPMGGGAPGHA